MVRGSLLTSHCFSLLARYLLGLNAHNSCPWLQHKAIYPFAILHGGQMVLITNAHVACHLVWHRNVRVQEEVAAQHVHPLFFYNPLSPIGVAHMHMGVAPPT